LFPDTTVKKSVGGPKKYHEDLEVLRTRSRDNAEKGGGRGVRRNTGRSQKPVVRKNKSGQRIQGTDGERVNRLNIGHKKW